MVSGSPSALKAPYSSTVQSLQAPLLSQFFPLVVNWFCHLTKEIMGSRVQKYTARCNSTGNTNYLSFNSQYVDKIIDWINNYWQRNFICFICLGNFLADPVSKWNYLNQPLLHFCVLIYNYPIRFFTTVTLYNITCFIYFINVIVSHIESVDSEMGS